LETRIFARSTTAANGIDALAWGSGGECHRTRRATLIGKEARFPSESGFLPEENAV
jgi:hypothetical protein